MTETEVAEALNREDELGKFVSMAFSFKIPPFSALCVNVGAGEGKAS